MQIGLHADQNLSGKGISDILMTALPVIGKKDPDILKLLLYHCLQSLEGDEKTNEALINFHHEIGKSKV